MRDPETSMAISVAFAPSEATPDLIVLAEELGFHRAWLFDSPAIYGDIWMTLGIAAERTKRIGLGSMIIPSLRHPVVTASAIAQLESLAPGRVAASVGSGFSARYALDDPKPMRWADVEEFVVALKALMRGERVEWQGHVLQLLHSEGYVAERPLDVPVLVAAEGPKGLGVARAVGDGMCSQFESLDDEKLAFPWVTVHAYALALEEGESLRDQRVMDTMAWLPALYHHVAFERNQSYDALPNGQVWRDRMSAVPERERHLAIHRRHMDGLNELDEGVVTPEVVEALLPSAAIVGSVDEVRKRFDEYRRRGVDELMMYVPLAHAERTLRDVAAAAEGVAGKRPLLRARGE
ncbi:LLM class flavin-dependent oxidoreductase [Nocardioides carbamazepini]|uniref:LLM class flavin-dependent oxidoreductase n=1 Tax=Nocardioides carbamazepini TaxID=2854259 RepID=UPI00214A6B5F|nr:LLM class flavin-dependent oxidoreductase [Nocardioides carbamazepini]MCR1783660.1 LLM class flavin-dependent oxidoreductase [Nocardioides carbamazepini]